MTPAARIAAAIALLDEIDAAPARPADAVASGFFRSRRFIGSSDRRSVSDLVWRIFRTHRRLTWWLNRVRAPASPRLLVAASLILQDGIERLDPLYSGARFAPDELTTSERSALRALKGHTLEHPAMPEAVQLEVPDWIMPRLSARFGAACRQELAALLEPAPLDLRVNLLKGTREDASSALRTEGLEPRPTPFSPWGLRVIGRHPVTAGAAFRSGLVEIQDEGSQLVAALTGAAAGMRVCDWCAGAGGKTLALAMTMQNRGQIVACDISASRLEGAVRRLRRAGVHNAERHMLIPGDKWTKRRAGTFDRVLVDAPCTGTGTWRRNPDARLRLTETDLLDLLPKQAAILDSAKALVRKGQRLVYATCSLLTEENDAQVEGFLSRNDAFRLLPLAAAWPFPGTAPCEGPFLTLTPAKHGTDGFFAAVLERVA